MSSQTFYHGTQTAIHQTDKPYLDPSRAPVGKDEGDPNRPHTFVTPDKLWAKVFALKAENTRSTSVDNGVPCIVYAGKPKGIKPGWLYTCPEDPNKPFEETIARGKGTGMYVSYDPVKITQPEHVPSLEHVMKHDNLQAFSLREGIDTEKWSQANRDASRSGKQAEFYKQQIKAGNLTHLNAEMNISPHPNYAVSQEKSSALSMNKPSNLAVSDVLKITAAVTIAIGLATSFTLPVALVAASIFGVGVYAKKQENFKNHTTTDIMDPSPLRHRPTATLSKTPVQQPSPSANINYRNNFTEKYEAEKNAPQTAQNR
ncbi:MAG: hypothetical protein P8P30_07655 [Rickettsiales bacterium]|nr:hypothetical protein [Rickettsiales bacterium]